MRDRHYRDGYWDLRIRRDWRDGQVSGPGWWSEGEEREEEDDELDPNPVEDKFCSDTAEQSITRWM